MPLYVYNPTQISNIVSVSSIVTVYHLDLREWTNNEDVHDFPEIFYVENGYQTTCIDGKQIHLDAGQMVIYAPNAYHGPTTPPAKRTGACVVGIVSFIANAPQLEKLYNRVITLSAAQQQMYLEIMTKSMRLFGCKLGGGLVSELPQTEENLRELQRLKNMLEMFLLDLNNVSFEVPTPSGSNRDNLKQDQMREITEYMLAHIDETLTLDKISRALGFSVSKLRRLVYEQKGCGPIAYFIDLKIDEAKHLIRRTSMNITEISEKLGFSSLHYFSKQFKNKTGRSPSAYAKTIDKK